MLSFLNAPIGLAYHIVFALAQLLAPLGAGLATAAAIVVFTVAVRLLLSPLSYRAYRGQAAMTSLQPRIAELRKRYGSQPERLQRELSALYRAEGGGMLAGCLPLLLQLPFFSVMYRLFLSSTVAGHANDLLTRSLLGTPLGSHWLAGAGPLSIQGLLFAGLFALIAGVAFLTARAARQLTAAAAGASPAVASLSDARTAGSSAGHRTAGASSADARTAGASPANARTAGASPANARTAGASSANARTAGASSANARTAGASSADGRTANGSPVRASGGGGNAAPAEQPAGLGLLTRLLPYSTVVIAAFVPLAAGIYLLTTTTWTAVERALLRRWSPAGQPAQPV